jgi:hypothetical protein
VKRSHSPEWSGRIVAGSIAPRLQETVLWNSKKVAKNLLGELWLRGRRKILKHRAAKASRRIS